jgi:hypothetical protein
VSAWRTDPEGLRREEMPAALCPAARSDGYMFVVGKAMSLEIHCRLRFMRLYSGTTQQNQTQKNPNSKTVYEKNFVALQATSFLFHTVLLSGKKWWAILDSNQ